MTVGAVATTIGAVGVMGRILRFVSESFARSILRLRGRPVHLQRRDRILHLHRLRRAVQNLAVLDVRLRQIAPKVLRILSELRTGHRLVIVLRVHERSWSNLAQVAHTGYLSCLFPGLREYGEE